MRGFNFEKSKDICIFIWHILGNKYTKYTNTNILKNFLSTFKYKTSMSASRFFMQVFGYFYIFPIFPHIFDIFGTIQIFFLDKDIKIKYSTGLRD